LSHFTNSSLSGFFHYVNVLIACNMGVLLACISDPYIQAACLWQSASVCPLSVHNTALF